MDILPETSIAKVWAFCALGLDAEKGGFSFVIGACFFKGVFEILELEFDGYLFGHLN